MDSELVEEIMRWGREKGIDSPTVQLNKVCEEALETKEAYTEHVLVKEHNGQ